MNFDHKLGEGAPKEKINVTEEEKETIQDELDRIEEILKAIEEGDGDYAYADTRDSMETLDSILNNNKYPSYEKAFEERKVASKKCMQDDETEKKEGLMQVKSWVEKIRELL